MFQDILETPRIFICLHEYRCRFHTKQCGQDCSEAHTYAMLPQHVTVIISFHRLLIIIGHVCMLCLCFPQCKRYILISMEPPLFTSPCYK